MIRPRQTSDEDILAIARNCFLAHGPSVSTQMIADELGISQGVLFKRFGTKEALMLRALHPTEEPAFIVAAAQGPTDAPLREQIESIAQLMGEHFAQMVPAMTCLAASSVDMTAVFANEPDPPPVRALRALCGFIERAKADGRTAPDIDPASVAAAWMGAIHLPAFCGGLARIELPTPTDYVEHVGKLIVRALGAEEA